MPQGWTIVDSPSKSAQPSAPGWEPVQGAEKAPDFRVASVPAAETFGEQALEGAQHLGEQLNPLTASQTIVNAALHPINAAKAIGAAQGALFDKAKESYQKGDYLTAGRHFVDYLLPLVGPGIDKSADEFQAGKWGAGTGDALGIALQLFAPDAIMQARAARAAAAARAGTAQPVITPTVPKSAYAPYLTPEERASNAFADASGIPKDAATATGSPFVRGIQKPVGESLMGQGTAAAMKSKQAAALERVGNEIADSVTPGARSPEQGGQAVSDAINGLISRLKGHADAAYGRLRELEDAAEGDTVPEGGGQASGRQRREETKFGRVLSDAERGELARIQDELETYPYEGRTWVDRIHEAGKRGNAGGGDFDIVAGHEGAPVYKDIEAHLPGEGDTSNSSTYVQKAHAIRVALHSGEYGSIASAALDVARKRLAGNYSGVEGVSHPMLPESAARVPAGSTEEMKLAVDMREAKQAVQPLYADLARKAKLVPLMGDEARVYTDLDKMIKGPDYARLTDAESAKSTLGKLAEAVDDPNARRVALKTKAELEGAIDLRAAGAGDDVADALHAGRAATREKYSAKSVLDSLPDEPVRAFDKLMAPRDGNVNLLRSVAEKAPESIPELGRAKLQQWLDLATERGRFDHADRLYAEWNRLGPETKRIVFGRENVGKLDHFFLFAKRVAENPNPSGTATTMIKSGEMTGLALHPTMMIPISLGSGVLSKILYTPRGVDAITRLMKATSGAGRPAAGGGLATSSAVQAARLELANAARAAGVPAASLPLAADRESRQ